MNKLILTILTVSFCTICYAQTTETKFYSSPALDNEVPQEKAKFSRTIVQEADGTTTTSKKDIRKDKIVWSETFKGEEPFGVWVYQKAKGLGELNYNFQLVYSSNGCSNDGDLKKISDYFVDNDAIGYKAPKLAEKGEGIYQYIGRNIIYPAYARRRGIQGVVNTSFVIMEDGTVGDIVIVKGSPTIHLDKEAVRILRELKFTTPAMVNGQATRICVKVPITFKLA